MNLGYHVARLRHCVLRATFKLLYTRLGLLHEATGRLVFGAAWDGRRQHVVPANPHGTLLDLGCGEGLLLRTLSSTENFALGVDPSRQMTKRAINRRLPVIQATAQALPLRSTSIGCVVATYPGPWIVDQQTWDEIARVTAPGASVNILLGGDYAKGRWSFVRSRMMRLAYGNQDDPSATPRLGHPLIHGDYQRVADQWGTVILWSGHRIENANEPLGHRN